MKRIKKTILFKGLVAGAIGLALVPFALPAQVHLQRATVIPTDAATIYALVSSNRGFQQFNPWRDTDPTLKTVMTGPRAGVGSGFRFEGAEGSGTQTITAVQENREVTMLIDLGALGQPVQSFLLKPHKDGTEVTWTFDSDFGLNPIGRIMGLFLDDLLGPTWVRGLDNLSAASVKSAA